MPPNPKKKPLVIVTRKLPDAIETRLMELFDTRLNSDDKPLSSPQLVEAVKPYVEKAEKENPSGTGKLTKLMIIWGKPVPK